MAATVRIAGGSNTMVLTELGYLLVLCSVLAVSLFCWLSYSSFLDRNRRNNHRTSRRLGVRNFQ